MGTPDAHATPETLRGLCAGCTVFAGGRKIGVVDVLDAHGLIIKVGVFGRRRVSVPFTDIERIDETVQAVYLHRLPPAAGV